MYQNHPKNCQEIWKISKIQVNRTDKCYGIEKYPSLHLFIVNLQAKTFLDLLKDMKYHENQWDRMEQIGIGCILYHQDQWGKQKIGWKNGENRKNRENLEKMCDRKLEKK